MHLRSEPADTAAGPNQLERQEQPPCVIALIDCTRNNVASHRGGIEPVTAKTARQPNMRHKFADLRHAVKRIAENACPNVFDFDGTKLREHAFDASLQLTREIL